MPEIRPFRGIIYNPQGVNLNDVVAPPYDVISPERQDELYGAHPYNVIRLILGREEDRYGSAAEHYQRWCREGILTQDQTPSMYLLTQTFRLENGREVERRGLIAACRLEEFRRGSVFPHEKTLSEPKEDRLKLLRATGAMFSQIFALYSASSRSIEREFQQYWDTTPDLDIMFEDVRNRLWRVTGPDVCNSVSGYIREQKIFVADGHHRYETALSYASERKVRNPNHTGREAYNFVPICLVEMNDPGLIVFPTHRLIHGLDGFRPEELLTKLRRHFDLREFDNPNELQMAMAWDHRNRFGLVLHDQPGCVLLELRDEQVMGALGIPAPLARLDVSILHTLILKEILGISDDAQEKKLYLEYEKDSRKTVDMVKQGKAQAAFLMSPTRVEEVRAVAEAGFTMPQKSTYFYPKLISGLVTYSFDEL